jgi:hypothetical protein
MEEVNHHSDFPATAGSAGPARQENVMHLSALLDSATTTGATCPAS